MTSLLNSNISLRAPEPGDLDILYLWENDTSLWRYGSTRAPLSRHQLWQYLDTYDGDVFAAGQVRFMIVDDGGETVGTVDLFDLDARDGRASVGIFISPQHRRRGYAEQAIETLCEYARTTLSLHQLAAWVMVDNKASVELFKKSGFKSKGFLRSWVKQGREYSDVAVFQRLFE